MMTMMMMSNVESSWVGFPTWQLRETAGGTGAPRPRALAPLSGRWVTRPHSFPPGAKAEPGR